MKMANTLMSVVAGLGLAAGSMSQAQAALISSWDFLLEAGFDSVVPAGINQTGVSGGTLGLPTKLEWGTPSPSSLELTPTPIIGTVATSTSSSVVWVDGTNIIHNNLPVDTGGTFLSSARILDQIDLTSGADSNVRHNPFFHINFNETLNFPNTSPDCPAVGDANGCKDIFVLNLLASAIDTEIIDGSLALIMDEFLIGDYFYKVALRSNPEAGFTQLEVLTDAQCEAANATTGCVGTTTFENASNTLALQFTVLANQVPEPGILALFGIGMAGLGFARRRKESEVEMVAA
jgi:hypothetical protein